MPHPGNEHRSSRVSFPWHWTLSIQIGPVPLPKLAEEVARIASVYPSILVKENSKWNPAGKLCLSYWWSPCDWAHVTSHVTEVTWPVMWLRSRDQSCDWAHVTSHVTELTWPVMWLVMNGLCWSTKLSVLNYAYSKLWICIIKPEKKISWMSSDPLRQGLGMRLGPQAEFSIWELWQRKSSENKYICGSPV